MRLSARGRAWYHSYRETVLPGGIAVPDIVGRCLDMS